MSVGRSTGIRTASTSCSSLCLSSSRLTGMPFGRCRTSTRTPSRCALNNQSSAVRSIWKPTAASVAAAASASSSATAMSTSWAGSGEPCPHSAYRPASANRGPCSFSADAARLRASRSRSWRSGTSSPSRADLLDGYPVPMRLATFNILHARSVRDGTVNLDRLRAAIHELDADVLAMQEVDCDQPRSELADLTAVAAEAMDAVSHRFVAALAGTPAATWSAATGEEQPGTAAYGVALLSRYPARHWQTLRLPRIPMRFPMYLPGPGKVMMVREE